MKRPAFQFYPGDWQRDAALRSCSVAARGLWIDMICVMHQAEPYGHLVVNARAVAPETLARMVGASAKEVTRWLGELEGAGVFDRNEGVIVSRRMVRDEAIRKVRAEGGKLGGNPALKDRAKVTSKVNHPPNLQPTPAVAVLQSSSSPSTSEVKNNSAAPPPDWLPPEWEEFERHRREKRAPLTPTARAGCIRKLEAWRAKGHDVAAILRHSIDNGYTGLFEPNGTNGSRAPPSRTVTAGNIAAAQEFVRRGREEDERENPTP